MTFKWINLKDSSQLCRFIGENLAIKLGDSYTDIGLCISNDEKFELDNSLFLGADLFDTNVFTILPIIMRRWQWNIILTVNEV